MRRIVVVLGLFVLACAKPEVESEDPDPTDESRPSPANGCPASKLREVRYGSTVARGVQVPAEIGARTCVEDLRTKLADDIACAQAFNDAAWARALEQRGLTPLATDETYFGFDVGQHPSSLELGSVHPDPEDPSRRLVFLGVDRYDCSAVVSQTRVGPGVSLARDQAGDVVVVIPKPTVEARNYTSCSCFPGCGAWMEDQPRFAVVPDDARLGEAVELVYPAIAIVTTAVESTTCCCAP